MSYSIKAIGIDLDGTLVDSAPDIALSIDTMLESLNRPKQGLEKVRSYLGNGVEWLVKRALTGEMWAEPPMDIYEIAMQQFTDLHTKHNGQLSTVYPGVTDTLDSLKAAGIKLSCITNKKRCFTLPLLTKLNLLDYFSLIICGDDLPSKKPSPLPLRHLMQKQKIATDECLMVGDSITDIKTARAAGIKVIGVTYGYNHGQDIRTAKPDWAIDSMQEIHSILQQSVPKDKMH